MKMMKKCLQTVTVLGALIGATSVEASLYIDFGLSGSPVEPGFQAYTATNASPASFTAQSYSAFSAVITVLPSWTGTPPDSGLRMVDRSGTNLKPSDAQAGLRDWIGIDGRSGQAVGSDLVLTLSDLPAGNYSWTSFHHDMVAIGGGVIDVTVADANGLSTSLSAVTISSHASAGGSDIANAATLSLTFDSNGTDPVSMTFHNQNSPSGNLDGFFVMNGFMVDVIPEPGTLSLVALFGGTVLLIRRRFMN